MTAKILIFPVKIAPVDWKLLRAMMAEELDESRPEIARELRK